MKVLDLGEGAARSKLFLGELIEIDGQLVVVLGIESNCVPESVRGGGPIAILVEPATPESKPSSEPPHR